MDERVSDRMGHRTDTFGTGREVYGDWLVRQGLYKNRGLGRVLPKEDCGLLTTSFTFWTTNVMVASRISIFVIPGSSEPSMRPVTWWTLHKFLSPQFEWGHEDQVRDYFCLFTTQEGGHWNSSSGWRTYSHTCLKGITEGLSQCSRRTGNICPRGEEETWVLPLGSSESNADDLLAQ